MEIPEDVTKKHGSVGESVYKKGHKDGKLEGAKVAKSPFATEVNNVTNSILKARSKDGYKAPDYTKLANLCQSSFKIGVSAPDRNKIKAIVITGLKVMESMVLPPKKEKAKAKETPPTSK